jgi:hypothetical protein
VSWRRLDPSSWPAWLQIGIAAVCLLLPMGLAVAHWNLAALLTAVTTFGVWCWLGSCTRPGFFLFDTLTLWVSLGSVAVALCVLYRWLR